MSRFYSDQRGVMLEMKRDSVVVVVLSGAYINIDIERHLSPPFPYFIS